MVKNRYATFFLVGGSNICLPYKYLPTFHFGNFNKFDYPSAVSRHICVSQVSSGVSPNNPKSNF